MQLLSPILGAALGVVGVGLSPRWTKLPRSLPLTAAAGLLGGLLSYQTPWPLTFLVALLITVSITDLQKRVIPNEVILAGLTSGLLLSLLAGQVIPALLGGILAFAVFFIPAILSPKGIGMGDVKLAAVIGLHTANLGELWWQAPLLSLFIGAAAGAVIGLILIVLGLLDRKTPLPFGPFMAAGAITVVHLSPLLFGK